MRRNCFLTLMLLGYAFLLSSQPITAQGDSPKAPKGRALLAVGLDSDSANVKVVEVMKSGPADKGGIQSGDVIVGADGVKIKKRADLLKFLAQAKPQQEVKIDVLRDDKPLTLKVKLGTRENTWQGGIVGQKAPDWRVDQWDGLAEGKDSLNISDVKGKVVYLYCFQAWCPGCHSHGFPVLKQVQEKFKDADDVEFVVIQTVFEGHSVNTPEKGKSVVREKFKLDVPLGYDGEKGKRSTIMTDYKTRGTPWTIIIDKEGVVRRNGFSLEVDEIVKLLKELQEEGGAKDS